VNVSSSASAAIIIDDLLFKGPRITIKKPKIGTHPVYAPHSEAKQSLLDVIYAVLYCVLDIIDDDGDIRSLCTLDRRLPLRGRLRYPRRLTTINLSKASANLVLVKHRTRI